MSNIDKTVIYCEYITVLYFVLEIWPAYYYYYYIPAVAYLVVAGIYMAAQIVFFLIFNTNFLYNLQK